MKIGKTMEKAINEQINAELYSAYLYLSMSAYFESLNLRGFARWMRAQANEEKEHAMKFFDYLFERGGTVTLKPIDAPPAKWKSPLAAFVEVYAHELKVTELIHRLVALAEKEKDYASMEFLQWYVKEQVEEEAHASEIEHDVRSAGTSWPALMMIDHRLGERKAE